ncbi:hypothetical protein [Streptomyces sp. CoH27]|uniref:hypothetical protein n=1 Tax=Streptomyces sp. CoH27 TaxID=2875763 RepID=UPI0027E073AC|nr:hypothetical protein [Streptomyces sp. CoH27]
MGLPSVVAVHDAGDHTGPEHALELTAGVVEALDHVRRHGIVLRDIKPANVMLSHRGTGAGGVASAQSGGVLGERGVSDMVQGLSREEEFFQIPIRSETPSGVALHLE